MVGFQSTVVLNNAQGLIKDNNFSQHLEALKQKL